jgi:succinate dehydrogenase/fumarate reductase flavoprotein subunit
VVADNSFDLVAIGGGFAGLVAALFRKAGKNKRLCRIPPILFSQGSR